LLNQLGDLLNEYTINITNTANIVNTTDINNNDDDDDNNKNVEEYYILNLLIEKVEEDKPINKFRPVYLFIYIFTRK
jgi:hypothetical protein